MKFWALLAVAADDRTGHFLAVMYGIVSLLDTKNNMLSSMFLYFPQSSYKHSYTEVIQFLDFHFWNTRGLRTSSLKCILSYF